MNTAIHMIHDRTGRIINARRDTDRGTFTVALDGLPALLATCEQGRDYVVRGPAGRGHECTTVYLGALAN